MSYTEYLNRKKATAPVILDTRRKVDASTWTRQERLKAAGATYTPTKSVVGNIRDMVPDYRRDNKAMSPALFVTSNLGTGGAVPNASARTDYIGGQALMGELRNPPPTQKLVLNNTLGATMPPEMTVVSGCNRSNMPYPVNVVITSAVYDDVTGALEYTAANTYVIDEIVSVSGITGTGTNAALLNGNGRTITAANATTFTVVIADGQSMSYDSGGAGTVTRTVAAPDKTYPSGISKSAFPTNPENVVAKNGSDFIRANPRFPENGCDEAHEAATLHRGIPQFVDDTISLTGVYGIGIGGGTKRQSDGTYRTYTTAVGNNRVGDFFPNNGSTIESSAGIPVTHTQSAVVNAARVWGRRPTKGAGGLVVPSISSEDHKYKVGGLVPSKHLKYIEKHHGNDMNVNPRRVPTDFIPPANAPKHLKINDPTNILVK
jgi:hypothetical protein